MNNQKNETTVKTFGPYSPVRQAGNIYFISGQIGVDPDAGTASNDLSDQVRQALENLGRVLASVDLTYNDVVKTTLYLTEMSHFARVNEVYVGYFNEPRPARTTVGVAALPLVAGDIKLCFELDAMAVRQQS